MSDIQTISILDIPVDALVSGEIKWKDYINSLTPEDLERQRQYDRSRAHKWYLENKERKAQYCKERYENNKDKRTERHTCEQCGGSYQFKSRAAHRKTKKHQHALIPSGCT